MPAPRLRATLRLCAAALAGSLGNRSAYLCGAAGHGNIAVADEIADRWRAESVVAKYFGRSFSESTAHSRLAGRVGRLRRPREPGFIFPGQCFGRDSHLHMDRNRT